VLTAGLDGIHAKHDELGFRIKRLNFGRREAFRADLRAMWGYVLAGFWEARNIVKTWNPDLIHVHFAVPAGLVAWLLGKFYGVPYVLTAHLGDVPGGAPEKTDVWFRWVFPFTPPIWKNANRVVAVSEFTKGLALAKYPIQVEVIPNGVDTKTLRPGKLDQKQAPRIVFAGRFMEQKNPLQLVQVLSELKNLPWDCLMFGDGPLMGEVRGAIIQKGLKNRIQLKGWKDPKDVLKGFSESEILFMPSRSEGLPVVGVQALASGLAIVAGNSGGFVDLVQPGRNGYLFDADDTKGMIQGLEFLIKNPESLQKFRECSLEKAKHFDLETIISRYEELFCQVIKSSVA
jgi:glycosyltransferase involved in cell wall biosynthesis